MDLSLNTDITTFPIPLSRCHAPLLCGTRIGTFWIRLSSSTTTFCGLGKNLLVSTWISSTGAITSLSILSTTAATIDETCDSIQTHATLNAPSVTDGLAEGDCTSFTSVSKIRPTWDVGHSKDTLYLRGPAASMSIPYLVVYLNLDHTWRHPTTPCFARIQSGGVSSLALTAMSFPVQ